MFSVKSETSCTGTAHSACSNRCNCETEDSIMQSDPPTSWLSIMPLQNINHNDFQKVSVQCDVCQIYIPNEEHWKHLPTDPIFGGLGFGNNICTHKCLHSLMIWEQHYAQFDLEKYSQILSKPWCGMWENTRAPSLLSFWKLTPGRQMALRNQYLVV